MKEKPSCIGIPEKAPTNRESVHKAQKYFPAEEGERRSGSDRRKEPRPGRKGRRVDDPGYLHTLRGSIEIEKVKEEVEKRE